MSLYVIAMLFLFQLTQNDQTTESSINKYQFRNENAHSFIEFMEIIYFHLRLSAIRNNINQSCLCNKIQYNLIYFTV
jgi:hypothetical protein